MIFLKEQIKYFNEIKKINSDKRSVIGSRQQRVYIETFGCNLNENDSEKILGILEASGYINTFDVEEADLIILNTCCVRENAENRLFGRLGEVKKYSLNGALIAVCGCMMQELHMVEKIKRSYPYVRLIFGTHTLYKLPENLYNILLSDKKMQDNKSENKKSKKALRIFDILDVEGSIYEGIPTTHSHDKAAFVPIIYGCDNFCTYCIVPYVRGRERSRKPKEIINEIIELAKEGFVEVTLLGQNVNSYKGDEKIRNFADLLDEVAKIDGIEKIRFISPHPKDFTKEVAEVIAKNKNISRNLHYPVQSGSTKVLKEMNRIYTKDEYLKKADMIKEIVPDVTFSTDIIVGFPGETEEDFEETLDVVKEMKFEQIFMFIYSPRVGTQAANREDQIPYNIAQERFSRLKVFYEDLLMQKNEEYIGKTLEIIIEEETGNNVTENLDNTNNENNQEKKEINIEYDSLKGRTDSNKIIIIPKYDNWNIGDKIKVEILENRKWYLKGRKID